MLNAISTTPGLSGLTQPNIGSALSSRQSMPRDARSFAGMLARATGEGSTKPEDRARHAAEQFVAIALVQPVLKQFRESSNAAPPFAPTQAEKQFQSLADAQLAERLVHAKNFPLVDRLAQSLMDRSAGTQEAAR